MALICQVIGSYMISKVGANSSTQDDYMFDTS